MRVEPGQVAVVTGAANGIGAALARALSGRGARVVLADVEERRLAEVAAALDGETLTVRTDVADETQVHRLADTALHRFGTIDLLFNNAGTGASGPSWQVPPADWQRVLAVNLGGVVHGIRAVVPAMVATGHGHIVNTASVAGLLPDPFHVPYTASKHAIVALSESLREELAIIAPGIGVTAACLGPVDTRLLRGVPDDTDERPAEGRGAWLSALTPEQWERFQPTRAKARNMKAAAVSPERAAETILAAVESDRMFVTTDPSYAAAVRDRAERIAAELEGAGLDC